MKWLLIWFVFGGGASTMVATASESFQSEDLCLAAKAKVEDAKEMRLNIRAACVKRSEWP